MKKFFLIVVLAAAGLGTVSAQKQAKPTPYLSADDIAALEASLPSDAPKQPAPVSAEEKALRVNQINDRANAYHIKGDYDRAIADYTVAIKLSPREAVLYRNRGGAYYKKKAYDLAITDYNEAIRLDPKNAAYYLYRGYAYESKKDRERAIADYRRALKLDPKKQAAQKRLRICDPTFKP